MGVKSGYNGAVYLCGLPSVAIVGAEACTDSGDLTTYTTNTHHYWDKQSTFTVQCSPSGLGGTWSTVTDYKVQWIGGKIIFNSARVGGVNNYVQVSVGKYFTLSAVGDAYDWQLNQKGEQTDTTPFGSAWHTRTPILSDGTIKVRTWKYDNFFANDLANLLSLLVVQLFIDTTVGTGMRMESYAWLTQDTVEAVVKGVVTQDFSFDTEGPVYYVAS